jgi:hypothetical protein
MRATLKRKKRGKSMLKLISLTVSLKIDSEEKREPFLSFGGSLIILRGFYSR